MQRIARYVGFEFLRNFTVALVVLTFVMCIGSVIKAIDYLARGASGSMLATSFLYIIPYMLTFTIPIALIVSVLLVFNRLSLDGELTAMMASGLSLWQISSPVVVLAILLCGVSLFNNSIVAPMSHYAERKLFSNLEITNPVDLLEEGQWVRDFPGMIIYVGAKDGNHLKDVILYEMDGQGVSRRTRAESGTVTLEEDDTMLVVNLFNARITKAGSGESDDGERDISTEDYTNRIPIKDLQRNKEIRKRTRDLTMSELVKSVRTLEDTYPDLPADHLDQARQSLLVEAHQRMTLGFSCVSFGLCGIGLGVRSKRKGTSAGIVISLAVIFVNYFFIILSQSLTGHPQIHPELIQWIPIFLGQGAGVWLLQHRNR